MKPSYWSASFFLNCASHPQTPVNVVTPLPAANAFAGKLKDAVSCARDLLLHAQRCINAYADESRKNEQFEVREYVSLSTKF